MFGVHDIDADLNYQGVEAFLSTVLLHCPLPAYLYNFPKHTGNTILPEMYARLAAQHPGTLMGIKVRDSSVRSHALR